MGHQTKSSNFVGKLLDRSIESEEKVQEDATCCPIDISSGNDDVIEDDEKSLKILI